jgi:WD40 repeat protein
MNSNGQVKIWNYETQTDLKTFEVTDVPVRCVRYIARKNWVSGRVIVCLCTGCHRLAACYVHRIYGIGDVVSLCHFTVPTSRPLPLPLPASSVPLPLTVNDHRSHQFVSGSDDFQLRVYNISTGEKITSFEAHPDYIRCLTVHPTLSLVLTGSDDMTIKCWDWDKQWRCVQVSGG